MDDQAATRDDTEALDELQGAYKAAVEEWIAAIRQEEALASRNHSVEELDKWEQAHFAEEEVRGRIKAAKKEYVAPKVLRLLGAGA